MTDTKNDFEEGDVGSGETLTRGVSHTSTGQKTVSSDQIEALWRFVATRAAVDDLADATADSIRTRVGAVGLYIQSDSSDAEEVLIDLASSAFERHLVLNGLKLLRHHSLERGSYGAILFVESKEAITRDQLRNSINKVIAETAKSLWIESRRKAVSGTVTLMFGAAAVYAGVNAAIPVTRVHCNPDSAMTFQHDVLKAQGAKDLNEAVQKHCTLIPATPAEIAKNLLPNKQTKK